ncbi:hypothetical protein ACFO1B_03835 [Dactylosporangium siamense]|uniref:Uncharacterized protein n=1 Tax=Dactylosporangium siamense TaxID=685454 RepID=A0A919U980_9ACTN|nr:hypothetical protein [Dactylosporangium siamense]GIG42986.1 hypothetical protein Dsi01nite_010270 [Dactylosporangium siamense]
MAALGTRKLTLSIDGDNVTPEVSSAVISSAETDSDFVSFADAAAGGGRTYTLKLTMVQDTETGSLWDQIWSHAGQDVPVTVRPHGNAAASATLPHFTGAVTITEPDGDLLGGEADASTTARFTTDVEWTFLAKPTRITA